MSTAIQSRREPAGRVAWGHVVAFTLFAYAIAWAMWASLFPEIRDALSSGRTGSAIDLGGVTVFGMFAPALAAVAMRAFVSREGFRGSLGPIRRRWRYYAVAVVGSAVFVGILIALAWAGVGGSALEKTASITLTMLLVGVPIGTVLAFGEEYGWRGYLLPKLLPLGEVRASLLVALIWAPWHLPVLLAGLNYPGRSIPVVLAVFGLSTVMLSLVHTRLFVASGMSVLVVSVLHGSLNTFSDGLTDASHISGNPLLISGGGIIAAGIMAVVVFVAYAVRNARRDPFGETAQLDERVGMAA
jgi:uncharacterized protein